MERGIIEDDPRHTVRNIRAAMQGNVIRALVELITNSDDSYVCLEEAGKCKGGAIEIEYKKAGYCGLFAVRDHAEGMSIDTVRNSFKKYGAATSGFMQGKKVRGYFGQGAKDAIASMDDGRICTFRDGSFVECRLFIENGKAMYQISDVLEAHARLRDEHKMNGNGTVIYFKADPQKGVKVPQFKTVHEELANNYLLRKLMCNERRKVLLLDSDTGDKRHIRYEMPVGKEIFSEDFNIPWASFGDFPIRLSIWRAEEELNQYGDNRQGGLLIVDEETAVLGISLFKFDNEPLAARLYGEARIGRFRELLQQEEPVLSDKRDGLIPNHPFCQLLISEVEKRLEIEVKNEKIRKQKEDQSKIDREERDRYRKAFSILNEIAELEAQAVVNLGQKEIAELVDPPNGFCLYPSSAQLTVGKRYAFALYLNTRVVHHGAIIDISSSNSQIRSLNSRIIVNPQDGTGVIRKYITVEGREPSIDGILKAETGGLETQSKIYVVPEKEDLLSEGMVFQPQSITLRPNQPKRLHLLVYIKLIEGGSEITLSSDNDTVHISKYKIPVIEADAVKHIAKYDLEIWGDGSGQNAMISAECGSSMALLEVKVVSKGETQETGKKGMFNEPEYNYDTHPLQRTSYSMESGRVIIYVNFPSTSHYLGENCQFRKTLPAQVLIADLVAERCFFEIARKKVETSGAIVRPEAEPLKIQQEAYELSRKYGKKIHEALVDANLIKESRRQS